MLGCLGNVIGLGEVFGTLNDIPKANRSTCGCGEAATTCPFWGQLLKEIGEGPSSSQYPTVLRAFEKTHPGAILVDSSKSIDALKQLQSIDELDIKVIYLVRDVRAWVSSIRKFTGNNRRLSAARLYIRWYRNNLKIKKYLSQSSLDVCQIGYEELVLNQHQSMKKLSEFIGVDSQRCALTEAITHNLGGNRMMHDKQKRKHVVYDSRWFTGMEWILPSILFPMITIWNNKQVHGNIPNLHGR